MTRYEKDAIKTFASELLKRLNVVPLGGWHYHYDEGIEEAKKVVNDLLNEIGGCHQ